MKYRPREKENKTKKLIINISPTDHKFLKAYCAERGETMTRFIIKLIKKFMKKD